MKVPKHLVAAPVTNELDDVTVYYCVEYGYVTSGVERADRQVLDFES